MRYVGKGPEPVSFINWKAQRNEDWEPTYSNLQNPEKRELHEALLREQGRTCCYCGRAIELDNSHIEHFRPKHRYINLSLTYTNLFASCIRETDPGSPLHCGHRKDDWFDENSYISPLDERCEEQFSYNLDGRIISNSAPAQTMSDVLGLQMAFLENRRREALAGVFDNEFLLSVSLSDLERLAIVFRERGDSGELAPFFHVIARYAEQLIAATSDAEPITTEQGRLTNP